MVQTHFFWHFAALCLLQGISRTCQKRFECSVPSNSWTANERLPNAGAERSPSIRMEKPTLKLSSSLCHAGVTRLEKPTIGLSTPGLSAPPLGNSWDGLECFSSEGPTMRLEATVSHFQYPSILKTFPQPARSAWSAKEASRTPGLSAPRVDKPTL